MAIIEQHTSQSDATSWRVKIRIKGNRQVSATFKRRTDAKQWAAKTESDILEGRYFQHAMSKRLTLSEVITLYCAEGKRLLDDREVFAGDEVFDAQGRSYACGAFSW